MKRQASVLAHSPPRTNRRPIPSVATLAFLAALGACLEPDKPGAFCDTETPCGDDQTCDVENHACILTDDADSSSSAGAKQASALIPPPPGGLVNTTPNSGWTEGSFDVSHSGTAEYDLPLWVPDGRRGVQPNLSLHYSSQGGNGPVGVGWSLQGLSSITPCPRTIAQDGVNEIPSFTGDDAYCLDGQRLRPTGPSGWPGSLEQEYRTEREIFARIIAHTPPPTIPGQLQPQPDSFKVWTKDGRILTFGGSENAYLKVRPLIGVNPEQPSFSQSASRVIVVWGLRKVEDRNGNAIDFEYSHVETNLGWAAMQMTPKRITYGPDRSVDFVYELRPDPIDRFQSGILGGLPTRLGTRLKTIQMFGGTELLREYRLTYQANSITARSLLNSISECDHNGTCLLPLEFDWSLGSYDFEVIDANVTDVGVHATSGNRFTAGDINGDGRDDLIYGDAANQWKMRISNGMNGFGDSQNVNIPRARGADYAPKVRPVDYNRDGRLDLLVEVPNPQPGHPDWTKFSLYRSTGSNYQLYAPEIDSLFIGDSASGGVRSAYFVDLDGNGLPDYLAPQDAAIGIVRWRFRLNLGLTFAPMQTTGVFTTFNGDHIRSTDFDGDRRSQLLTGNVGSYTAVHYDEELTVSASQLNLPFNLQPENADRKNLHFADVNGDGCGSIATTPMGAISIT